MIVVAIVASLFVLYLWSRQRGVQNEAVAKKLGVDHQAIEEAVMPKNVYLNAAKQIGAGALESAKLATDNAREVVGQVQKDAKIAKLEALLGDDDLMAALRAKVAQESKSEE